MESNEVALKEYINIICEAFIFEGIGRMEVESLLSNRAEFKAYKAGENIALEEKNLGVITFGRATVKNTEIGTKLNTLYKGDCFGFATLFNDCPSPKTMISAEEECTVMFISQDNLESLMKGNILITKNYIKYLSKKVCFLNEKISGFIKYGAKERLREYISKNMIKADGNQNFQLDFSIKELSNILNVGRASLYRAFSDLESEGIIKKSAKTIKILNLKYFELY